MDKQLQKQINQSEWKSVTVRLKENDIAILNSKLKLNGFQTLNEFVHVWIKGEYPTRENNEQVEKLIGRIRNRGIKDPLTGEFNPTFYRNVDLEEMLSKVICMRFTSRFSNSTLLILYTLVHYYRKIIGKFVKYRNTYLVIQWCNYL